MESGEEVSRGLLVTRCDGSELFDEIDESLDEVSFAVEGKVAWPFDPAVFLGWDDRNNAADFEVFNKAVGIIPFVTDERLRRDLGNQCFGLRNLVDLAFGEAERERVSQGIDNDVDLGRRAAAGASYGLVLAPFFRAPALCW